MDDAETISAIAAVAAALIAIGAAWTAKKSADKSIAAERDSAAGAKRSAAAAEEALAIEKTRLGYEESDRAAANAPRLSFGDAHYPWTLAQNKTALVGHLHDHGSSDAMIQSITLAGPEGPVPANPISDDGFMAERSVQQVMIPWPWEHDHGGAVVVTATYEAANGTGYRASLETRLRRTGADPNGQPLFRPTETALRRLN